METNANATEEFSAGLAAFLERLEQAASAGKSLKMRPNAPTPRHPDRERLYDYVLAWLPEAEAAGVRAHIAACADCSRETLRIMRLEKRLAALPETKPALPERLVQWLASFWEPLWAGQPVTAAEIPPQTQTFTAEQGHIRLTCSWKAEYRAEPAYIHVVWQMQMCRASELWLRFVEPETQALRYETCLGAAQAGEERIARADLGFDPSCDRWAIALGLREI